MRIPKWLYKHEQEIGITYTDNGNGDIDAERALAGQDKFFIKSDTAEVLKPKTLIISDWSLEQYTKEQTERFKKIIQELLLNNFTIYIWQDSRPNANLTRINELNSKNLNYSKDNFNSIYIWQDSKPNANLTTIKKLILKNLDYLETLEVKFNVKPISKQDLITKMKQKNIAADQLEILDYFNCQRLLQDVNIEEINQKITNTQDKVLKIEDLANSRFKTRLL